MVSRKFFFSKFIFPRALQLVIYKIDYFQLWFFLQNLLARISTAGNIEELPDLETLTPRKSTISPTLLIRLMFQGYRCESGIVIEITLTVPLIFSICLDCCGRADPRHCFLPSSLEYIQIKRFSLKTFILLYFAIE